MMAPVDNLAIVVPLKSFSIAKSRLRDGGISEVDEVSRSLARGVLLASRARPLFVACESSDVATFSLDLGALTIRSTSRDLNEAVTHAYEFLSARFEHLIIAHGDLRWPEGLGEFSPLPGVTVVTDTRGTGTNVLALPTALEFNFAFGPDSAASHQREAQRLGIACHVTTDSPWRFDVDEPRDLLD
jgi:2-phospho-L-lactate guanylyltransferase (CobY/MobA/RfbA family)